MPVENNQETENPEYSFSLRSDSARDFARRRRYGDEESNRVMSQVSSPLQLPKLGRLPRRSYSPLDPHEQQYRYQNDNTWNEQRSYSRRSNLSNQACQALEFSDQLTGGSRGHSPIPMTSQQHDVIEQTPQTSKAAEVQKRHYMEEARPLVKPLTPFMTQQYNKYLHDDNDDVTSYVMPVTKKEFEDYPLHDEDDAIKEINSYVTKRNTFPMEEDEELQEIKNKKYKMRTRGGALMDCGYDGIAEVRRRNQEKLDRAPMFEMKLRSHVIWEKMYVKFTCTIKGSPPPRITWYHNMVPIEPQLAPAGKYKLRSSYGVHSLEILKSDLDDSGTYRVSAQNYKGEISSYATLLVRRYDDGKSGYYDIKSGYNLHKPSDYPDVEGLKVPGYPHFICALPIARRVKEGDAIVMTCELEGKPTPEVFWTLNGRNVDTKKNHVQTDLNGRIASLTILKAFTDDEGEYVCRAYNSIGASTTKSFLAVDGVDSPPSAPSCLEYNSVTKDSVNLTWKPPGYVGHFGGSPVVGYTVEIAEAGSSMWKVATKRLVKLTQHHVTNLTEGAVYFFRARSITKWGRGPASLPIGPVAIREPGSPRLDIELSDPESLVPPETDDIFVEEEDDLDLPDIPTNVVGTLAPTGDCVCVNWEAPEGDNIDGFVIEYSEESTNEWKSATTEPLKTSGPYPVMGLVGGSSYKFRVLAVNASGCGEPSDTTEAITVTATTESEEQYSQVECQSKDFEQEKASTNNEEDRERYRGPPTAPCSVESSKCTRECIEIRWIPPSRSGGEQVRYYVEYKEVGTEDWLSANHAAIRYTEYPVNQLTPGERYMFRVRAVNKMGTSPFSEPSEPVLASDGLKPPNWWGGMKSVFRVAEDKGKPCVSSDSIKVCWEEPSSDGGSRITGYFLEVRQTGGKFRPVNNKALAQRHFTLNGLKCDQSYEFRVRACNIAGCGAWKNMPGRVTAKNPECPSDPTDVMFTDVIDEMVCLEWKKPKQCSELLGYLVERRKEGSDFWIPCNKLPEQVKEEKYKVDGLVRGQTYFFRVTCVNKYGSGIPSLQSPYVTAGEPWDAVKERQDAMLEAARIKREAELERLRLSQEEERKEAFLERIEDCHTRKNGQATFHCRVKDPNTVVTWHFGNFKEVLVQPIGKYDVISVGRRRTLIINDCSIEDVQVTHCVASYNNCTCTADLIVDGECPVHFVRFPLDLFLKKGETAIMDCLLSKSNAKVEWSKNDVTITSEDDDRYEFIVQGAGRSLVINDVSYDDIAMYTVSGLGGSYTINLVVDGVLPVKFDTPLIDSSLPYDTTVAMFECLAVPSPLFEGNLPACKWYHGDELIDSGDERYEIVSIGNKHTLKIFNPTFEDNGMIKCVVEGGTTVCELQVDKPPPPPPQTIRAEDYIINFEQGLKAEALPNALRLYCIVSKLTSDARIIWYLNNEELTIDNNKYKCFNDTDSGLVSLVITPISRDLGEGRFTCEFITPLTTFDTKVNLNFVGDEFEKIFLKSEELFKEEDEERKARLEERKKKKEERTGEKLSSVVQPIVIPNGIEHDVRENGDIIIFAETTMELDSCEVVWLKDSVPASDERHIAEICGNKATLRIIEPCADDAATYSCQIKSNDSSCEMSSDVTGKVFKELLLKSADVRINSGDVTETLDTCDVITEEDVQTMEVEQEVVAEQELESAISSDVGNDV